jgi:hypothetical protein
MSLSKLRGNENIADVITLEPYADIDQIRETLINVIRWLGDREPVAPGDVFLKFATYGGLVDLGLVTTQELLTNEDNPGDGNDPAAPEELYVEFYAKDMTPSVTAGCSTLQVVETASANPNLHFLAFDPSTNESCDFVAILPAGWTGGTFQFRIYWSHGFGSVAWNTVWELQANSYKTGETLARVLVPGTLVRGTGGAVDGLYITNESDPVYISGELNSPGNLVLLRITRKATDALDTLTVDARLHAIRFNLGNAPVDYPPPAGSYALLMHFNGDLSDSGAHSHVFTSTGPATSAALKKWGSHALLFGGSGKVSAPYSADFAFGARKWSVDFWIYVPASVTFATDNCVVCVWNAVGSISWYIGFSSFSLLRFFSSSDGTTGNHVNASSAVIPRNAWAHVAVWYTGTNVYSSFNGGAPYSVGSTLNLFDAATGLSIGATNTGGAAMPSGVVIDELRICVDDIDYGTTSFTPPTGPY